MPDRPDQFGYGSRQGTGVGTNAGVTVTLSGTAGQQIMCSGIQVSGDAACLVTVESPSGTVLWKKRYTAAFGDVVPFGDDSALQGARDNALLVKISASTTNAEANIQGYNRA